MYICTILYTIYLKYSTSITRTHTKNSIHYETKKLRREAIASLGAIEQDSGAIELAAKAPQVHLACALRILMTQYV